MKNKISQIGRHNGYAVAIAMVLVVLSFAVSLGYSHFLLQPISGQALSIMQNAVPSLQHLANVRMTLARLDTSLAGADPGSRAIEALSIENSLKYIDSEFSLYRQLPTSPSEALWSGQVARHLEELTLAIDRIMKTQGPGSSAGESVGVVGPIIAQADAAVHMLQRLNETEARENAGHILQARRKAIATATVLGSISLAIAIVATLLVLRVLRTRADMLQRYVHLVTERSAELDAFAGQVAHDLRDPIVAIAIQLVAVTRHHLPPPELGPYLTAMHRQLERMNQIIDALLEFARAGAAPTAGARADLRAALTTIVAGLRPRLEAPAVELTVAALPALEVVCTPGALNSVLSNLLGNAAKYVVEGSQLPRRIAVRVQEEAQAARVEIEDNGPGIPAEAQGRIFEPFQRLTSRQPGVGLGLATVKKIVDAYQGRLGVRSQPGKGSVFWFLLPKVSPDRQSP